MHDILKKVMQTPSAPGAEEKMSAFLQGEIGKYFDETYFDNAKNLIFHKKGNAEKVMFCACLDTNAVIATSIEEKKIFVTVMGSIKPETCDKRLVVFENGDKGLFVNSKNDETDESYVELLQDEVNVSFGDKGFFDSDFAQLSQDVYAGFGLGTKLGIVSMIMAAKNLSKTDKNVYFVFTTQSKLGFRSGIQASDTVKPDKAYVVGACEHELGQVLVRVADKSFTSTAALVENVQQAAKACKEDVCLVAKPELLSLCAKIVAANEGCEVCQLDLPVKHCDTIRECASLSDAQKLSKILEQLF